MEEKKKKSHISLIIIIVLLLILSIGLNICLFLFPERIPGYSKLSNANTGEYIDGVNENLIQNSIDEENSVADFESNGNIDLGNTTKPQDQSDDSMVVDLSPEDEDSEESKVDKEELKVLIEQYSIGINRIDTTYNTKESNTILLFVAKKYFDTQGSKASLNIDTKYAQTAQNYHKYLSELTGNKYNNIESIESYSNYMYYSKNNKSYVLGKNSETLTKEDYVCTAIDVLGKTDDVYTGKAIVTRTVDDVKTVYQLTFTFKVNKNYEYQKYNILTLNAINSSFYPDNTVHLEGN